MLQIKDFLLKIYEVKNKKRWVYHLEVLRIFQIANNQKILAFVELVLKITEMKKLDQPTLNQMSSFSRIRKIMRVAEYQGHRFFGLILILVLDIIISLNKDYQ